MIWCPIGSQGVPRFKNVDGPYSSKRQPMQGRRKGSFFSHSLSKKERVHMFTRQRAHRKQSFSMYTIYLFLYFEDYVYGNVNTHMCGHLQLGPNASGAVRCICLNLGARRREVACHVEHNWFAAKNWHCQYLALCQILATTWLATSCFAYLT